MPRHPAISMFTVAGGLALAGVIALAIGLWPGDATNQPPRDGWMQNFTPHADAPPAPPLTFEDAANKPQALSEFKGRVVLLNFWATWCGPCIREMPTLLRLHRRLEAEGLSVIAVSLDRAGWPAIAPFVQAHGLAGLPILHDPGNRGAAALSVKSLPTTVLIGRDGREQGRLVGIAEWDSEEAVALIRHYLGVPAGSDGD